MFELIELLSFAHYIQGEDKSYWISFIPEIEVCP